jgi:hypothetical protein
MIEDGTMEFRGEGRPLSVVGLANACDLLRVHAVEVWAVLQVETLGCGFLEDRRPQILFERHVFYRETNGAFDDEAPDLSSRTAGGYGAGRAHQYDLLARAIRLDRRAALRSTSWGLGQVMGFNAARAGFADVEAMIAAMVGDEDAQLAGMATWIEAGDLHRPLRVHDWASFARGYNGANYAINQYDTRLAAAFSKLQAGGLPDLMLRQAQVLLTYLGYRPGPVDGIRGRFTRDALRRFQADQGLVVTGEPDDPTLAALIENNQGQG